MYPFLRDSEVGSVRTVGPRPGIRVTAAARGQTWFFPGSTPEAAMVLVNAALYPELLSHPRTEIAFGLKDGRQWKEDSILKAAEQPGGKAV